MSNIKKSRILDKNNIHYCPVYCVLRTYTENIGTPIVLYKTLNKYLALNKFYTELSKEYPNNFKFSINKLEKKELKGLKVKNKKISKRDFFTYVNRCINSFKKKTGRYSLFYVHFHNDFNAKYGRYDDLCLDYYLARKPYNKRIIKADMR